MVKRLRHRPFTAVTRVRFPLESLKSIKQHVHADFLVYTAPWPSGKAKVCNTSITSSNLVGASENLENFSGFFLLKFWLD